MSKVDEPSAGALQDSPETKRNLSQLVPVTFEAVRYTVKVKKAEKVILDGVSGVMHAGRMTALMGPSGSGKTTLLDVIAGRKTSGAIDGEVLFAGQKLAPGALRNLTGYVEQFDTLIGELSVKQMLMYTAELKLPPATSRAAKEERVQRVITKLGLAGCADTTIGNVLQRGISGGQAKRVNIALALITQPRVLFLDEPTSGLDSHMANEVVQSLHALLAEGRTIVCTIHSPTSKAFALFDDLLVLKGGKLAFGGPVSRVEAYFEALGFGRAGASSLPEWLVDVMEGGAAAEQAIDFADKYAGSPLCAEMQAQREKASAKSTLVDAEKLAKEAASAGALKAFATLLNYRMRTHYKSGEFLGPRIGDKIFSGVLILSLYWGIGDQKDAQSIQSTASLLYFVAALCGYGAAAFVPSLTLDRPLFYRELADGCYSPVVYYLAKFVEEAVLATTTSLLFALIVFFSCSLQGSFWVFALVYFLTTMTGICLAYGVAALVPTMEAANAVLPTYVTMCMYFGGLFLLFDKIPKAWDWFSWTSFLRYSWGAMMNNQYSNTAVGEVKAFYNEEAETALNVNEFYGIEGDIMGSVWACVGLLALLMLCFATCGACTLSFVRHGAR